MNYPSALEMDIGRMCSQSGWGGSCLDKASVGSQKRLREFQYTHKEVRITNPTPTPGSPEQDTIWCGDRTFAISGEKMH